MTHGIQERGILVVVDKEFLGLSGCPSSGLHLTHPHGLGLSEFGVVQAGPPDIILQLVEFGSIVPYSFLDFAHDSGRPVHGFAQSTGAIPDPDVSVGTVAVHHQDFILALT